MEEIKNCFKIILHRWKRGFIPTVLLFLLFFIVIITAISAAVFLFLSNDIILGAFLIIVVVPIETFLCDVLIEYVKRL